jgi:hypothetical protein
METNKISAVLSVQQQTAVLGAIDTIEGLLDFLQGMSQDDRSRLVRIKNARLPFIQKAYTYAQQNPGVLPVAFSLVEFGKDVALLTALSPIITRLTVLLEKLTDTELLVKVEGDQQAREVYDCFKRANKSGEYDAIVADLGYFFAAQGKKTTPPPTPPTPPAKP